MRKYISLLLASVVSLFTIVVTRLRTHKTQSQPWISLMQTFWRLRRQCSCSPHCPAPCRLCQRLAIATFTSPSPRTGLKFISSTSRLCFAVTVITSYDRYDYLVLALSSDVMDKIQDVIEEITTTAASDPYECTKERLLLLYAPSRWVMASLILHHLHLVDTRHRSSCPRCWRSCRMVSRLVYSSRPPG